MTLGHQLIEALGLQRDRRESRIPKFGELLRYFLGDPLGQLFFQGPEGHSLLVKCVSLSVVAESAIWLREVNQLVAVGASALFKPLGLGGWASTWHGYRHIVPLPPRRQRYCR